MPGTRGLSLISAADLLAQADEVARARGQLAVHAIGDAANAEVIGVFETLAKRYGKARRLRIEHLQIADPKDLPRLKPAGIIASMQPTHQTSDRTMAEARLGMNRLGGAYAWNTIRKMGVPLAFGSDFPVESPDPFPGLSAAISRQDPSGEPKGGWRPQERVSLGQAIHGFTTGAAYAGFAETRMGGLDSGQMGGLHHRRPRSRRRAIRRHWRKPSCWKPGLRENESSAKPTSTRTEHRRGQQLGQFLRLGLARFVP